MDVTVHAVKNSLVIHRVNSYLAIYIAAMRRVVACCQLNSFLVEAWLTNGGAALAALPPPGSGGPVKTGHRNKN